MVRDRVSERYNNDPVFHQVVDFLRGILLKYELTPSEIREAAMFACIMNESMSPRKILVALTEEETKYLKESGINLGVQVITRPHR